LHAVREAVDELAKSARIVAGNPDVPPVAGDGAFISPILLRSDDPWGSPAVHDVEAFGPVSTIMPYRDLDDAIEWAKKIPTGCKGAEGCIEIRPLQEKPAHR
jgi:oxepin-CoA hydrolase/3-oxo-5,6-dehydrosuberyl-CoA semialdehyde dehydrogenase